MVRAGESMISSGLLGAGALCLLVFGEHYPNHYCNKTECCIVGSGTVLSMRQVVIFVWLAISSLLSFYAGINASTSIYRFPFFMYWTGSGGKIIIALSVMFAH